MCIPDENNSVKLDSPAVISQKLAGQKAKPRLAAKRIFLFVFLAPYATELNQMEVVLRHIKCMNGCTPELIPVVICSSRVLMPHSVPMLRDWLPKANKIFAQVLRSFAISLARR